MTAKEVPESVQLLTQLRQRNQATIQRLAAGGVQLTPHALPGERLEALIGFIFDDLAYVPSSPEDQRIAFETIFETRVAKMLSDIDRDAQRSRLLITGN